jgi:hypothetical protein
MAVINDLVLNTQALEKASKENIPLPTNACLSYLTLRERFTDTLDGKKRYMVDGEQFKQVVHSLGTQASTHAICSPDRYPSEKLDILVADAQLNFKIAEYEAYDKVQVTGVKIIYASDESKNLGEADYIYKDGSITLIDPTMAKNLVELQVTYTGYEK